MSRQTPKCKEKKVGLSRKRNYHVMPHEPFHVRVSDFTEKEIHLSMGMMLIQDSRTVASLTILNNKWIQEKSVNTVCLYKLKMDKAKQVDKHVQLQSENNKRLAQDWKDAIQLTEKYSEWKFPFVDMMDELSTMWDAYLGRVVFAKHRSI